MHESRTGGSEPGFGWLAHFGAMREVGVIPWSAVMSFGLLATGFASMSLASASLRPFTARASGLPTVQMPLAVSFNIISKARILVFTSCSRPPLPACFRFLQPAPYRYGQHLNRWMPRDLSCGQTPGPGCNADEGRSVCSLPTR